MAAAPTKAAIPYSKNPPSGIMVIKPAVDLKIG
jgi:hypothetical protein